MSIQLDQFGDIAAICGEEASCSNAFEGELRNLDTCLLEKRWKPLAAIWHGHGELSYRLPINHPSPDAGYSVDVLYPALSYSPVFRYTREEGFTLTASTVSTSTSTGQMDNTKISLPIRRSHRRKLNDVAGTTEQAPNRYSDEQGPSFPSRTAVRGNIVRPIALFGQNEGDSGQVHLQDEYLTASCFTIQATRTSDRKSQGRAASNGSSMDYIYQERDGVQPDQQPPGPVLLSNPGGNQLFRAFLEGIGAVLPPTVQDTVFGQNADDEDEQELFYPIKGPLHYQPASKPESQPYAALDLEGTWVGGYSTHGYEFGRIVVRNTWTRIHTADEVALEQIYDDESVDAGNADPSVAREPLMNSTIEGSLRRRRTIVEYIKITGDVNVPAGQVSWVAVLPSAEEERIPPSSPAANGFSQYTQQSNVEPDLDTMSLPTVKRSDWQAWSDLPPNSARLSDLGNSMPRWEEGTVRAAGRIAFTGFVDTRFIDAQATFVREENGEVDEIRVKWCVPDCLMLRYGG